MVPSDAITAGVAPHAMSPHRLGSANIGDTVVVCRHCREPLWSGGNRDNRPTHCPQCGNPVEAMRKKKVQAKLRGDQIKLPGVAIEAPLAEFADNPVDDESYVVIGTLRRCPNCQRSMADDGVLCVACGYNIDTGAQAMRVFEPVLRSWEGALSCRSRLLLMGIGEVLGLLALVGAFFADILIAGLVSWVGLNALLLYLLGTFDRIDISRTRRGYVNVTKTWRFCFVPRKPKHIVLQHYAGVVTGMRNDVDGWDMLVLGTMLAMGIVPGIVWWYCVFHRDEFYVGLTQAHGSLALELYRGWNEAQTREIAKVIRDVAAYP